MLTPTRLAAVFALVLAVAVFVVKGQDQAPVSPIGRFQLVVGDYVAISGNASIPEKAVFRIDTTTGKIWKFATGIGADRKVYQIWSEVLP